MSNDVGRVIGAEILKMRRLKSTFALPTTAVALAAIQAILFDIFQRRALVGEPSGFFVGATTLGWMTTAIALLAIVLTSFLISREFALGTIKTAWTCQLKREHWYAGKVVTAVLAVVGIYVLVVATILLVAWTRAGFGDLAEGGLVIHEVRDLSIRMALCATLTLFALCALVILAAQVATLVNNAGTAIAIGVGLGVVMSGLQAVSVLRPFMLTTYLAAPLSQMSAMSRGFPLPYEWNELLWKCLVGAGAWMIVAYIGGHIAIKRREVTS